MSVTVALQYPVEIDGVKTSALTLRRPKVRDQLTVDKMGASTAEKEVAMIAMLAEVAPNSLHELDSADYAALQKALAGFFS